VNTDPSPQPTPGELFYARVFALLTIFLLGILLYQVLLPFLSPLAWALFIAFLIHPLHTWIVGKLHGRANVSAAVLTVATLLILLGPLTALAAAFAAQVADLLQFAQRMATDHKSDTFADLAAVPVLGTLLGWLQLSFGVSPEQIQDWAAEGARTVLQFLASLGGKIFLGAVGKVVGFAMVMFILFFAIRDGQHVLTTLRSLVPMSGASKARLFEHLATVTRAVFFGSGVTALVQGALVGIAFAVVGFPSPIVFGVLAALFALVPLAGTPVVWAPAVLVLVAQQRWGAAIFMLVWGVMVALLDNVLRPYLVSGRADVGTLTVFIGVFGGISAFGPVGVLLGPLIIALVIALIRFTIEVREAEASGVVATPGETRRRRRR
jgi:predicted PurR-regulated permease PerM